MNGTLIQENTDLLNSLPSLTGDAARLAHRLSVTTDRLEAFISQAEAQFAAGNKHATFNRQTVLALRCGFNHIAK